MLILVSRAPRVPTESPNLLAFVFSLCASLRMDERWKNRVFPILPALLEILLPLSLIDGLIAVALITLEEYEELSLPIYNDVKRSRMLLLSILPKKGPDSFDRFVNVLKKTEGQEHVAQRIMENKRHKSSEHLVEWEEKVKDLERELQKEREEKNKEKVTNICLRTKVGACLKDKSIFGFVIRCI